MGGVSMLSVSAYIVWSCNECRGFALSNKIEMNNC